MAVNMENLECHNSSIEKHIKSLRKKAHQSKCSIIDKLKKSQQKLKEDISRLENDEKKKLMTKKLDKISKELDILQNLLEDDIVRFALTTDQKLMTVASNRRTPLTIRLKARVACHKPLSSHLLRIKTNPTNEDESEEEEELDSDKELSKPLDKMSVNNQIVKMRKNVKQAKVHIINKLTRNIKKLRSITGKNEEKAKKKAERLVKKIQCLKKLTDDEISRFALTCGQDFNKLCNDTSSTLKEQVMATVAIHKSVSPIIIGFKSKFPDCDKKISKILNQKKKKRKLNTEIINNGKQNKISKENIMYSESDQSESGNEDEDREGESEVSENESEHSKNHEENMDGTMQSGESEEDESEHSLNETTHNESSNYKNKIPFTDRSDHGSESDDESINKIKNNRLKSNNFQAQNNPKNKTKPLISIESDSKDVIVPRKSEKPFKKSEVRKKITQKVVDPFFVTSSNEEYVTSQVPSVEEGNASDWREQNSKFQSGKSNRFLHINSKWDKHETQNKFTKFNDRPYNKPTFNRFNEGLERNKFKTNLIFGNRKERRKALQQPVKEEKPEKLHPSWEAKKKLSNMATFQGKKITFD